MISLPPLDATNWGTLAPRYAALQAELLTRADVPDWLRRWSDLEKQVWEARAAIKRDRSRDERDTAVQARWARFVEDVFTPFQVATQALIAKLLALPGYTPAPEHRQFVRMWRAQATTFDPASVTLAAEIGTQAAGYWAHVTALTVPVDGATLTLAEADARLADPDRTRREATWRAIHARWQDGRAVLDDLFLDLVRRREHLAHQAGFPDYRAYRWRELDRADYTPADCLALHDAVATELAPLIAARLAAKRQALGVDTLRPWDLRAEPPGPPAWNPFGSVDDVVKVGAAICARLDPELGALFARMQAAGHLDPDARPGKAAGGEEWIFPASELPYARLSLTGTVPDVVLLLHETGHAFHDWLSIRAQGLIWNIGGPSGFEEFPSTALSYLGLPVLAEVLGDPEAAVGVAQEVHRQLEEEVIRWLPDLLRGDAFQHWVYTQPAAALTPAALDAAWIDLSARFLPGVDWRGLDAAQAFGWQRVATLFTHPFYYIEYALAHLGAIQLWAHARRDPVATWHAYRAALRAGYTLPVADAYRAAGLEMPLAPSVVREVAAFLAESLRESTTVG